MVELLGQESGLMLGMESKHSFGTVLDFECVIVHESFEGDPLAFARCCNWRLVLPRDRVEMRVI